MLKGYITMNDVWLMLGCIFAIFVIAVVSIVYDKSNTQSKEFISWVQSGMVDKAENYEVYEWDNKLYLVNEKENIVIPVRDELLH